MSDQNQRFKSPPYPSIDLQKALLRAEELREVAKGFPVPLQSAAKAWQYSPTSSSVNSVLGALNQFALLDEVGSGEDRRVKLSALADSILLDKRPDSRARQEAIRKAALGPRVFLELWENYRTWDVDEGTLVYELTLGRKTAGKSPFSATAAIDVARNYRQSLEFAGLSSPSNGSEDSDDPAVVSDQAPPVSTESPLNSARPTNPPTTLGEADLSVFEERKALDEGQAVLIWPRDLSPDSADDMEYWLIGVLRQIKRRSKIGTSNED